jgi:hypothetical protein
MRRPGLLAVALACAALTVPAALAQKAIDITPDYIVGIKLGMSHAKARSLLGTLVRADRLEDGYDRLVSGRQKVEVYFRKGAAGAVVVTTWSKTLRTDEQIGPCSTVKALRKAYGARLKPFRQGKKVVAYRLGNLIFTVEGGRRVGVVALGRGSASVFVALNAPECHL